MVLQHADNIEVSGTLCFALPFFFQHSRVLIHPSFYIDTNLLRERVCPSDDSSYLLLCQGLWSDLE
jgi:hypothetical protein